MSTNTRVMRCSPQDVFDVLADGWVFPTWVVGASRMRDVDERWPAAGSRLRHSFGVWPVLINDSTVVREIREPHRFVIVARGWPIGEALVTIDVAEHPSGCIVRMREKAVKGPGALIPSRIMDVPLFFRNRETLHRLAYVAEGRAKNGEKLEDTKEGAPDGADA